MLTLLTWQQMHKTRGPCLRGRHAEWAAYLACVQNGKTTKPAPGLGCYPIWAGRLMKGSQIMHTLPEAVNLAEKAARADNLVCHTSHSCYTFPVPEGAWFGSVGLRQRPCVYFACETHGVHDNAFVCVHDYAFVCVHDYVLVCVHAGYLPVPQQRSPRWHPIHVSRLSTQHKQRRHGR